MAIWGVTSLPPQVGQAIFPVARSAAVSTTSKLFLQLSHMNSYLGIGFLPSCLKPFPERTEESLVLRCLGTLSLFGDDFSYPGQKQHQGLHDLSHCRTSLAARRPTAVPGGPRPHKPHPPEICTASEGIKLTRVHHCFPRVGTSGDGIHLGIPYPQMAESRTGGSGHLDGRRRCRGEILGPDPGALLASRGRTMECTDTLRPDIRLVNAGSRSMRRLLLKSAGTSTTARPCSYGLSQAAVHSRAAGSGCSIQPDLQDGRIRPWDDSRSPPRCSSRSAYGFCLRRSG